MNKLKIVRTIQKKKLTEIPFDRAKSCKYYTTIHPMYKDICKTCIKARRQGWWIEILEGDDVYNTLYICPKEKDEQVKNTEKNSKGWNHNK